MTQFKSLPDIASQGSANEALALQWVGMDAIALPMQLRLSDGTLTNVLANIDVYVSLDKAEAKGIHMSRLYLLLNQTLANQVLDDEALASLLPALVESQSGISLSAKLTFSFQLPLNRPALLSDQQGFQQYPVKLVAQIINGKVETQLQLTVAYSSTCPCSASLSRQLLGQAIDEQFGQEHIDKASLLDWLQSDRGSIATPHSQRSFAYLNLQLANAHFPDFLSLINEVEASLGTPVQTAVKRADEQEFARLNAENLMFCEDAARRVKATLEGLDIIEDYWFKVEHQESLHAHNAVAVDQKYPHSETRFISL